jgi:diacylglycerol kinase family enzyme
VDVTIVPDLPLRQTILDGHRLFNGTMDRVKEVSRVAVCQLVALTEAETPTLVDVDGEQPGFLPLEMSVLPKALGVIRR